MRVQAAIISLVICLQAGAARGQAVSTETSGAQNNPLDLEITPALDSAVSDGVVYLASIQEPDGSWVSGRYGKNVAITSLACLALMSELLAPVTYQQTCCT